MLGAAVSLGGVSLLAPAVAIWPVAAGTALALAAIFWPALEDPARLLSDTSTGLPNRNAMMCAAEALPPAMVVVARIDRFAPIAGRLGPEATARFVSRVAERLCLANLQRPIYRIEDDSLAWMETEEDQVSMEDRLEAVVAVMRSPINCGQAVDVTLTLGIADDAGSTFAQLIDNAAAAASDAARKGLRWERFSPEGSRESDWHLTLLQELDGAMALGQVWNAYQPKLDLGSNRIVGAEALVRWLHPRRGPIAPDNFVPLAEEHGRVRDLTFHVLVKALEDAALWESSGRPIGVSVNVAAALLADEQFIEQVRQTLHHSPVPPERLTIEVTETAAIHNVERSSEALASWRTLGVNISIDDFGTGKSPIGYLRRLPATEIKIDRAFVQTIDTDRRSAAMVRSTIALAHELDMVVVAEGVESEVCLDMLKDLGCDTGQGFHIGRPMSAGNLSVFLGGNTREVA